MSTTKVAVGILRRDGKILACQRKRDSRYGMKWEFPGGKVEPNETIQECLARELREELSIALDSIGRIDVQTTNYDDGGRYEVSYCFVRRFTGEPRNNVFETIRWVTPSELRALDILEGNRTFVGNLSI